MAASFPASIKQFTTWRNFGDPSLPQGDTIFAFHPNEMHDEIFAIETFLGINPQGTAATVGARIAAVESGKSAVGHTHPQYMIPIGACFMFPNPGTVPGTGPNVIFNANNVWLLCNGTTFSQVTYPDLFAFLGSNTLPNLVNVSPMGAGSTVAIGVSAGSLTNALSVGQLPSHNHGVTDPSHNHGGSSGLESATHTHNFPSSNIANFTAGTQELQIGGSGSQINGIIGMTTSNEQQQHNHGIPGNVTSISINNTGSNQSFSILQPVIGVNWYIKALTVP